MSAQSLLPPRGSLWRLASPVRTLDLPPGALLLVVGSDPPWVTLLAGDRTVRLQHWIFGRETVLRREG